MGNPMTLYHSLFKKMQKKRAATSLDEKILIQVGSATCEKTVESDKVTAEFKKLIQASGREDILLKQAGCTTR